MRKRAGSDVGSCHGRVAKYAATHLLLARYSGHSRTTLPGSLCGVVVVEVKGEIGMIAKVSIFNVDVSSGSNATRAWR